MQAWRLIRAVWPRQGEATNQRTSEAVDRSQSDFNFFVGGWKEEPGTNSDFASGWHRQNNFEQPRPKRQNCGEADLTDAFCDPFLGSPLTPLPLLSLT